MILESILKGMWNAAPSIWIVLGIVSLAAALRLLSRRQRRGREGTSRDTNEIVIDATFWNIELLRAIEWKRFEELCAAYFEAIGFSAQTTRNGPDGGIDIRLSTNPAGPTEILVQCKAWNTLKVGVKPVRELFGVMANEKVREGIFVTTGTFTSDAQSFAPYGSLHLIDGESLHSKILALSPEQQKGLLRVAVSGDFITPSCPSCGIKLVLRNSSTDGSKCNPPRFCTNLK